MATQTQAERPAAPTLYVFDKSTGEYKPDATAMSQWSPRENKWLIPACATTTEPPAEEDKKARCWNPATQTWEQKPDHRGEKWYDKQTRERHEIKDIGVEPDTAAWTQAEPTDPASEWDADAQAWAVPFATQKERKKACVITYYDSIMATTKQGYSQGEIDTWETQVSGANDILAGDTSTNAAQFVISLAAARRAAGDTEMTAEYLAQRIKANAAAAAALQAPVMGKQGAEWKAADEATTQEELDAIVPHFDISAFMAEQARSKK